MKERKQTIVYLGKGASTDELMCQLEAAGLSVCQVGAAGKLSRALQDTRPGSLIVDLVGQEDSLACLENVRNVLDARDPSLQVIVLSDRADQEVRLRAVQSGSDVFLSTPVNPWLLMQYLDPVSGRRGADYRVLVIADNPELLAGAVPHLQHTGMTVKRLNSPARALLSMINFSPDLLLIEHPLSECRGDDIGRMIHQLTDYEDMPIIYIGPKADKHSIKLQDTAPYDIVPLAVEAEALVSRIGRLVQASRSRRSRIQYIQRCDQTSGLLNRDGFLALLEQGVATGDTAALVLCELENPQHHNPDLVPQQLNELIAMVANQLDSLIPSSVVDARIGDYIFAFLITGKSGEQVRTLGQMLSYAVKSRIYTLGQHSITVGCTVGIAVTHKPLDDGLPLFSLAVKACEEARQAGTSRVSVRLLDSAPESGESQPDKALVELLRDALVNNQFRLVYQPIASLRATAVDKYEVLLRLDDGGVMASPSRFVPVAERCGLMQSIDRWVIEQVVPLLKERGNGISLFVKVSSSSMRDPEFIAWLKGYFREQGSLGKRLVFQIRESNINAGIRPAVEFANQVKQLGCSIALDHNDISKDVVQLLEHIPASYIKINGQAINDIAENPERRLQLETVIELAERHKARVIAGFVEDANSLQLLWNSGVHYIQGNFLQEPDEALDIDFGEEGAG